MRKFFSNLHFEIDLQTDLFQSLGVSLNGKTKSFIDCESSHKKIKMFSFAKRNFPFFLCSQKNKFFYFV